MQPTNRLRYVRRQLGVPLIQDAEDIVNPLSAGFDKLVLQQWWEYERGEAPEKFSHGEWKDIDIFDEVEKN